MFIFTLACVFIVSLAEKNTKVRIEINEQQLLIKRLNEIVTEYDNPILSESFDRNINLHGIEQTVTIFPAKNNNKVFAHLVEHTYPNGYNGNIRLLTGISIEGELLGVRVINHKETPGLGDKIETRKSDWIKSFDGKSLNNPKSEKWKVKKDGGVFDQFTGATITPRAVVNRIQKTLAIFQNNRDQWLKMAEATHE